METGIKTLCSWVHNELVKIKIMKYSWRVLNYAKRKLVTPSNK